MTESEQRPHNVNLVEVFDKAQDTDKSISPDLKNRIKEAFLALEEILKKSFPNNRRLSLILTLLEQAAMYVVVFL